ncbi:DUF4440 domain-containing protein [Fodinicola acaciae]|uniref:DUF4440 domain-containing protein n=1 Tax=Fodinicola acaciae TaxID=2681555 RepID=UPI0013D37A8A|nr:DUF4440 domain-containing protein [Fodinicola acaciae]
MAELPEQVTDSAAFTPSAEDIASVEAWFADYDKMAARGDAAASADVAMFPLNVVSDGPSGNGSAAQWDRETYLATMSQVIAGGTTMDSTREPIFLTGNLVVVITNATFTTGDQVQRVRYADVLVRRDGRWLFQTMIQGGWGDYLGTSQ